MFPPKSNRKIINAFCWCVRSLLFISFLIASNPNAYGQSVKLTTKVRSQGPNSCSATVYLNGRVVERHLDIKRKCRIELDYGREYLIVFKQKGTRSKALIVNTEEVPEYMQYEELDFAFEIILDQPYSLRDRHRKEQLVAHWFFHPNYGEFDYSYGTGDMDRYAMLFNEYLRSNETRSSTSL